jgi:hypothetical protein
MFDVAVYLSSLPRIADRDRKMDVLRYFAQGAQSQGAQVLVQSGNKVVDSKLAVILGWVGMKIRGPHIQTRQDVITHQSIQGRHVMPIDSSCFKFADPTSKFLRYSLGGVFYNTNNYANQNSDHTKWQQISNELNISCEPWRTNGNHVLVCLQRDGGWSLKGKDLNAWTRDTVNRIRSLTDRPILLRPHPKTQVDLRDLLCLPNVTQSQSGVTLQQDLQNAWAAVFYNSSSAVAAVLAGIPVFAEDPDCVAWAVANHSINNIENPACVERQQWLYDLSAAHWTDDDSKSGAIYRQFEKYL